MKKMFSKSKPEINFVKPTLEKSLFWLVAAIFIVVGLVTWILTSFGTMDEDMNRIFFKGMSHDFIKGWTAFVISECYIDPFSYAIPLGLLIFESLMKWIKENKPNNFWARHYKVTTNSITGIVSAIYVIVIFVVLAGFMMVDYGFGWGFNPEFMTGLDYMVPIFIVSIVMNATIYGLQVYYYHNVLVKQSDFLSRKMWRRAWVALMFLLFAYIPVLILKNGFARPYWWNVHFNDGLDASGNIIEGYDGDLGPLATMKEDYKQQFWNYLHQKRNIINYGWNKPLPDGTKEGTEWLLQKWDPKWTNYYWWQTGHGWFKANNDVYDYATPNMHSFPSGHLVASMFVGVTFWVWFDGKHKSRKSETLKWILYSVALVYVLQMIFALEVSASHWWSDMAFTLFWAPIALMLSNLAVNAVFNKLNKSYKVNNW